MDIINNIKILDSIYDRFKEHDVKYGEARRNDHTVWGWVDEISKKTFGVLVEICQTHNDFNSKHTAWCNKVLTREPFRIREYNKKWRSAEDNKMIWHLMMMMREIYKKENSQPKPSTEELHTKFFEPTTS